ncbi:MAG: GTP cyclohydrolase I FolE2 [Deltaproteobacteria bacterium]|nr:GTP cyclohydrolase I FolE2 [Deltaproteobacteria bacterium]
MIDVQNQPDHRNLPIDKVGVKNIRYPITVLDRANGTQQTVASFNMYVNLPHQYKGTHMSRFVEVLSEHSNNIYLQNMPQILGEIKERLDAESAHMEVEFPYFLKKQAPVSGAEGLMEYNVAFRGTMNGDGMDLMVEIAVPITTLCPCSKEISRHGAHNQRGIVKLAVRFRRFIWIEDLITLVEESASSDVYSLLKRDDEKFVTEKAFDNPMFVEDVVREISLRLDQDPNIVWFAVDSENFESIHNHSAYAYIERDKRRPNHGS